MQQLLMKYPTKACFITFFLILRYGINLYVKVNWRWLVKINIFILLNAALEILLQAIIKKMGGILVNIMRIKS
jgi:hypothetical protein